MTPNPSVRSRSVSRCLSRIIRRSVGDGFASNPFYSCATTFAVTLAVALTCLLNACAPPAGQTDETQKAIRDANRHLAEMKAIQNDLYQDGFYLRDEKGPTQVYTGKTEKTDPILTVERLEKLLALTDQILQAASRNDVTFNEQDEVERIARNARLLCTKIKKSIEERGAEKPGTTSRLESLAFLSETLDLC